MVKECRVISANEYVTVVEFEGKLLQLPSIHSKEETVNVSYLNGKYYIVNKCQEKNSRERSSVSGLCDQNVIRDNSDLRKNKRMKKTTVALEISSDNATETNQE